MALVMALSLLPTAVFAAEPAEQTYVKVTEAPEDWSGTYLIVNEDNNAAFDGSLTALDAVNDYKTVTIEEGTISTGSNIAFTIAKMDGGYFVKAASGKYIYQDSNTNGLKSGDTATANTITMNEDGTVNIVSGGAYLRFNANGDQMRFRYYKSSSYTNQQPITLYKLEASAPERESGIVSAADLRNGDTVVIFNPANGKAMSTTYNDFYNNGTDVTLADGKLSGDTATDIWSVGINADGTYPFATSEGK